MPREMTLYAQNLISVMHGIVEFWTNLYGHDCIEFSMHTKYAAVRHLFLYSEERLSKHQLLQVQCGQDQQL